MSGTTAPPLLFIQSAINRSDWVLTVTGEAGSYNLRLNHNAATERQLWLKEDDPVRGGFFLRNPFLDLCLRAGSSQGGWVSMAAKTMDDPELLWRKENGDDWGCLNKLMDWEQKLNVAGDGPYDDGTPVIQYEWSGGGDNEYWKLASYDPNFGAADITYDEGAKTLVLGEPITAAVTALDNRSSTAALNSTVTLRTSEQKSYQHSVSDQTQRTLSVAQKFGAKFGIDKMFSVNEEGSVTATRSTTHTEINQTTATESVDVTVQAAVLVAPGKSYQVALMARHCTLTIPYTATVTRRTVAGRAGQSYTINGNYRFQGAYRYDILVTDPVARAAVQDAVGQVAVNQQVRS